MHTDMRSAIHRIFQFTIKISMTGSVNSVIAVCKMHVIQIRFRQFYRRITTIFYKQYYELTLYCHDTTNEDLDGIANLSVQSNTRLSPVLPDNSTQHESDLKKYVVSQGKNYEPQDYSVY